MIHGMLRIIRHVCVCVCVCVCGITFVHYRTKELSLHRKLLSDVACCCCCHLNGFKFIISASNNNNKTNRNCFPQFQHSRTPLTLLFRVLCAVCVWIITAKESLQQQKQSKSNSSTSNELPKVLLFNE